MVAEDRFAYEELVRRMTSEENISPKTESCNVSMPSVPPDLSVIDADAFGEEYSLREFSSKGNLIEPATECTDDFFSSLLSQMQDLKLKNAAEVKQQEAAILAQKRKVETDPNEFERVLRARLGLEPSRPPFRRLSSEELLIANKLLGPGPESEMVSPPPSAATNNLSVTRRDVRTLIGLNWLNDEVINMYMALIASMENTATKNPPTTYAFSTFFISSLESKGYEGVRRWTRRINLFSYELVLIPIHVRVHWILALIDMKQKTVVLLDSLGGRHSHHYGLEIIEYLRREHADKHSTKFSFNTDEWQIIDRCNVPQQNNGSDCGVFTCQYARSCAQNYRYYGSVADVEFDFTSADMPDARRRMAYELHKASILPPLS